MRTQASETAPERTVEVAELDLVTPFTTPELTRAAIAVAERLGRDLRAAIRLVKLQVVPYAVESSTVPLSFLKAQMGAFRSTLPLHPHIIFTRDSEADLLRALHTDSIVILASKSRPWPTPIERMALKLRRAGHRVVLVHTKGSLHA
jgi:hypothetical protein